MQKHNNSHEPVNLRAPIRANQQTIQDRDVTYALLHLDMPLITIHKPMYQL